MAVLFSSHADDVTGNDGDTVATSVWDNTQDGDPKTLVLKTDTPVPGRSKYFRIQLGASPQSAWMVKETTVNLSVGTEYYLACFLRFDRISGNSIWHDTGAYPESYDKLVELWGTTRCIITAGYPDWAETGTAGKFSFGGYGFEPQCTSGCPYEQVEPNVSPYSRTAPYLADYERWYAVVAGWTPSNGGTENGRFRLWINGVNTLDLNNIKTQDGTSPSISQFTYSPTIAQPTYDAPAHYRKFDGFVFASSSSDVTAWLRNPYGSVSTISGSGSIGKTLGSTFSGVKKFLGVYAHP